MKCFCLQNVMKIYLPKHNFAFSAATVNAFDIDKLRLCEI